MIRIGVTLALLSFVFSSQAEVSGLARGSIVNANGPTSYQEDGTGTFRYSDSDISLSQAFIDVNFDIVDNVSFQGVANYYSDGEAHIGFTQSYVKYQPLLSGKTKFEARAGFFYPAMSVENTDIGWLSKHFITNSAVNSWIGEELRTAGVELTIKRPGRPRRSPWSWSFHAAGFKGNDTIGALLTWRGFALHDRQSLHNDEINFAPYPSVVDPSIIDSPSWTHPFREIDGRWGFYVGAQTTYLRKFDLRYYYYDNQAKPTVVNNDRLYAWQTRFHSLASRYFLTKDIELSAQLMYGDTMMGYHLVFADYFAGYVAVTKHAGKNKFSARFDRFFVLEDDLQPLDINSSDGHALTLNWTHSFDDNWQVAVEAILNENTANNRAQLLEPVDDSSSQTQLAITYRF